MSGTYAKLIEKREHLMRELDHIDDVLNKRAAEVGKLKFAQLKAGEFVSARVVHHGPQPLVEIRSTREMYGTYCLALDIDVLDESTCPRCVGGKKSGMHKDCVLR